MLGSVKDYLKEINHLIKDMEKASIRMVEFTNQNSHSHFNTKKIIDRNASIRNIIDNKITGSNVNAKLEDEIMSRINIPNVKSFVDYNIVDFKNFDFKFNKELQDKFNGFFSSVKSITLSSFLNILKDLSKDDFNIAVKRATVELKKDGRLVPLYSFDKLNGINEIIADEISKCGGTFSNTNLKNIQDRIDNTFFEKNNKEENLVVTNKSKKVEEIVSNYINTNTYSPSVDR